MKRRVDRAKSIEDGKANTDVRPGQPIRYPLITEGEITLEYDDAQYQWDAALE